MIIKQRVVSANTVFALLSGIGKAEGSQLWGAGGTATGFPAVKAFCWLAAAAPRVPRAFTGARTSCAEASPSGANIHGVPPAPCPAAGRTERGAGRLPAPLSQAQSHLLNYRTELIVILTLTSLVITEKDSAPLNDELCV